MLQSIEVTNCHKRGDFAYTLLSTGVLKSDNLLLFRRFCLQIVKMGHLGVLQNSVVEHKEKVNGKTK